MTVSLTLTFKESRGFSRQAEPVKIAIPLARGALLDSRECQIIDNDSGVIVSSTLLETRANWSDGSVRWLGVDLEVAIEAYAEKTYSLVAATGQTAANPSSAKSYKSVALHTVGPLHLNEPTMSGSSLSLLAEGGATKAGLMLSLYLIDSQGKHIIVPVESLVESGNSFDYRRTFNIRSNAGSEFPKVSGQIEFYSSSGVVELELCIHNPAAARHPKGLWDLGEPSSNLFRELGITIHHPGGKGLSLLLDSADEQIDFKVKDGIVVEQLSSGGKNSCNRNHVDHTGCLPPKFEGFIAKQNTQVLQSGSRTTPLGVIGLSPGTCTVHISRFWQEFPTALTIAEKTTTVALFASPGEERLHELQPGECKRRKVTLSLVEDNKATPWLGQRLTAPEIPETSQLSDEHFSRATTLYNEIDKRLEDLVISPVDFFKKRETIDEFGWRHFGEVFADHESLYRSDSEPLLASHYNNQYDLVLGFGLQYLRTNDARWCELMNDLARHVVDIDIYRTTEDRVEYNNGLFWHTNHYVGAATATHRTFSKENYDSTDPRGCSGGPGPEHCYTSGLTLHYFMTGDVVSRDSVFELANWIQSYFSGSDTLLGRLHSIAKHEVPTLIGLVRRRSPNPYLYPLSRGTGNLLVALLDAHLISGERIWLDKAEAVIFNTFHPEDDPALRDLENVEKTWSHTIFLQAVIRYIATKDSLGEIDSAREHARLGFLTYSNWTLEYAHPYLDNPEVLEFVNDTWAAQDIRRYTLMCAAAAYDPSSSEDYLNKATLFGNHVVERLKTSRELSFSRIQAILLQNIGMATVFGQNEGIIASPPQQYDLVPGKPKASLLKELRSATKKLYKGLSRLNLRDELNWLRSRD